MTTIAKGSLPAGYGWKTINGMKIPVKNPTEDDSGGGSGNSASNIAALRAIRERHEDSLAGSPAPTVHPRGDSLSTSYPAQTETFSPSEIRSIGAKQKRALASSDSSHGDQLSPARRKEIHSIAKELEDDPDFKRFVQEKLLPEYSHHLNFELQQWSQTSTPITKGSIAEAVLALRREWEVTAANSPLSVALQITASHIVPEARVNHLNPDLVAKAKGEYGKYFSALERFHRTQYEYTQNYLASKGLDRVVVYRGTNGTEANAPFGAHATEVHFQPLNSWSLTEGPALRFAQSDIGAPAYRQLSVAIYPKERVYSITHNMANEAIILGGTDKVWTYTETPSSFDSHVSKPPVGIPVRNFTPALSAIVWKPLQSKKPKR